METEIFVDGDKTIKAKLFGRWIHVFRCVPHDGVQIVAEDQLALADAADAAASSYWFVILAVGDKCRYFKPEHVGGKVILPASPIGKKQWAYLVGKGELVCREEWFQTPDDNGLPCMAIFNEEEVT